MEFSFTSALMDGTLRNPFVRLCVLLSTLAVLVPAIVTITVLTRWPYTKARLLGIVAATLFLSIISSRLVFNMTVSAYANLGTDVHVGICFMPTNLWYRDFLPGTLAGLISFTYGLILHKARKGNSARPDQSSSIDST